MNKLFRTLLLLISSLSLAGFGSDAIALEDGGYDIFLLAGQSNMAGRGAIPNPIDADGEPESAIKMWDPTKGIVEAKDPIIHPEIGNKPTAVGMGMSFAKAYLAEARRTGQAERKVLLVGAAWGGTGFSEDVPSFHYRWVVTQDPVVGGDLYRSAVQRANAAINAALAENPRSSFKGILWHQGESDAGNKAPKYQANLTALIARFRKDLQVADLSVLLGQLGPFRKEANDENSKILDTALRSVAKEDGNAAFVSAEGLTSNGDFVHFDNKSQRELGRRYAEAYLKLMDDRLQEKKAASGK